jgi:hypothetical protein
MASPGFLAGITAQLEATRFDPETAAAPDTVSLADWLTRPISRTVTARHHPPPRLGDGRLAVAGQSAFPETPKCGTSVQHLLRLRRLVP